jgi:hypothetical protein
MYFNNTISIILLSFIFLSLNVGFLSNIDFGHVNVIYEFSI